MKPSPVALAFAEAIEPKIAATSSYKNVSVVAGKRFDKIVQSGAQTSVHAFIERETGFLIKAAGWSTPAMGVNGLAVRYRLNDGEFDAAVADAEFTGGYLYAGRQKSLVK